MLRKRYLWKLKDREIQLGDRTLIIGVLNVTPDSFSDGGEYQDPDRAFARARAMEEEGADIIDIGAESTRPGSKRISEQEELRRLVPVLKRLRDKLAIPISVDTYKASVADTALELGAEIINDPSGMSFDPLMVKSVVKHDAGLILNHMRGTPDTWLKLGPLPDVMATVRQGLEACAHRAQLAGLDKARIVLDPGLGFGKRGEQNYEILAQLSVLTAAGFPVLVGPSRKSFLAETSREGKLMATAAAVTAAIVGGAHLVRVHDVKEMAPVVKVADAVLAAMAASPKEESRERSQRPRPPRDRPHQRQDQPPANRPAREQPPAERAPGGEPRHQGPAGGHPPRGRARGGRPTRGPSYRNPSPGGRPSRSQPSRGRPPRGRPPRGPRKD